jgi:topoisomerase-4 subunit B
MDNILHKVAHIIKHLEGFVKVCRDFFKKDYDTSDIRQSIVAAVSVRVQEPVFESQTKTKLGSSVVYEGGQV